MTTAPCSACHMHYATRDIGTGNTRRTVVRGHDDQDGNRCAGSMKVPETSERWRASA